MRNIINDLVNGKMNVRKWILWIIALAFVGVIFRALWAVSGAVVAVSDAVKANPSAVVNLKRGE